MGNDRPVVGQIFSVPLIEGGYAWGFVSLIDPGSVHLCSFFDVITDAPRIPDGLREASLVLEDMPVGGAEFIMRKRTGHLRWAVTDQHMPDRTLATHTLYIMRSRPAFQLVDLADKSAKRAATDDEIARYPDLSVPFPPMTTKLVEKAVRHLTIDARLIGADRRSD